mmetsp:Transcript_35611/g.29946  ORF Transcript_35611/g.29946 Transcript_35611/m.29946 type:complete len:103 (-) Transcript_35611:40-348(-)
MGECNIPTRFNSSARRIPSFANRVPSVAGGHSHTCGINSSLFCWGSSLYGQTDVRYQPLSRSRSPISVSAGLRHSCALDFRGRVDCWGDDENRILHIPLMLV